MCGHMVIQRLGLVEEHHFLPWGRMLWDLVREIRPKL